MNFFKYYILFVVYFLILFIAYYLSPLGTDYYELNQLFNCINNPDYCPLEINLNNYSLPIRTLFKTSYVRFTLTGVQLFLITFAFCQLIYLSKKESLNNLFVIIVFFSAFLKDYYLNAMEQALALSFFLFSLNIKKHKNIVLTIASLTHISSILYFFKKITFKKIYYLIYLVIFINLSLFLISDKTLFSNFILLFESFEISKINYYILNKSISEGQLPLVIKSIFFLVAYNSKYIKNSPYKFVYLLSFLFYSLLLNIDILSNRFLSIGKIFEILAFSSFLNKPNKSYKWLISLIYLLVMLYINLL